MKNLLFIIAFICTVTANSQNFIITFTGSGASLNVSSVKVENIDLGVFLILNGNEALHLTNAEHKSSSKDNQANSLGIGSTPKDNGATFKVFNPVAIDSTLTVIEMPYIDGNRLIFTGISGNFITVKTDIPTSNKKVDFEFISCTDIENRNYKVVKIGSQIWMAENLNTTKFSDGSNIPILTDDKDWNNSKTGAYCFYKDDQNYRNSYGLLYNWYSVNTDKLCPVGWHVPSDNEWTELSLYLKGEGVAGMKLKDNKQVMIDLINLDLVINYDQLWHSYESTIWTELSLSSGSESGAGAKLNEAKSVVIIQLTTSRDRLLGKGTEWADLTQYLSYDGSLSKQVENDHSGDIITRTPLKKLFDNIYLRNLDKTSFALRFARSNATNETGFTALPGGFRGMNGSYYHEGEYGTWWSSSEKATTLAWGRFMDYSLNHVYRFRYMKKFGFSVRCIKD